MLKDGTEKDKEGKVANIARIIVYLISINSQVPKSIANILPSCWRSENVNSQQKMG